MFAATLNMAEAFLLGSLAMLVVVLLIEAFKFQYKRQSKLGTLNPWLSDNLWTFDNLKILANAHIQRRPHSEAPLQMRFIVQLPNLAQFQIANSA